MDISIDLGGTKTKIGIFHNKKMIGQSLRDSFSQGSFTTSIRKLSEQIDDLIRDTVRDRSGIKQIGLAFPGLVNVDTKSVISTNGKYHEASSFDFESWALKNWDAGFTIENDARAALVGEWQYGVGKGIDDIVMMTLGTGVGGVCLIGGKLLYGKHFQAGVLGGHFTIDLEGETCNCGNIGCVEVLGSSWKVKDLAEQDPNFKDSLLMEEESIDYKAVFKACKEKDDLAMRIVDRSIRAWAAGVVNMIHAYDPTLVILHGGVMKSKEIILPFIQNYVNEHAWTPWGEVRVEVSSSPDNAALYGMNYLSNN